MPLELRRPKHEEIEALAALYREGRVASELEYVPDQISSRLDEKTYFSRIWHAVLDGSDTSRAFVLWNDTQPIGFVRVGAAYDYKANYGVELAIPAATGEIHQLYVLPGIIGRGYGLMLLKAALTDLRDMGFTGLIGCAFQKNARLRDFVLDLGGHHLTDATLVVNDPSGVMAPHTSHVSFYYAELPGSLPGAMARFALETSE